MRSHFDAIVVGAGPAGSASAILLARAGWSVALIEKQHFPRRKVCGECISASNLPLLEDLGIGPAFEACAGPPLRRVALMHGEQQIIADLPVAAHAKYPFGRALGRETLDTLLLEQARSVGVDVLQPESVQAVNGTPGDWRCEVRSLRTHATRALRAPVMVAANGSWESLPLGRPVPRTRRSASDLFAFKANFQAVKLDQGLLPVLSFNGGYGGMVIADRGRATVACCIRRDRLAASRSEAPGLRAGEVIEALLKQQCAGVRKALRAASREGPWLAAGPLDTGIRVDIADGLLRVGNAAGEAHPIIGEGMSMALQGAYLLCAQLLQEPVRSTLRDPNLQRELRQRYAAQWRHQFEPRLRLAAAFAHLAMRPASAAVLTALAKVWPGLLTEGARWGGKVRCAVDPNHLP